MTDRELLELAARAAGYEIGTHDEYLVEGYENSDIFFLRTGGNSYRQWTPLTDDGDALRLAVRLGLRIDTPKHKGFGSSCGNQTVFLDGCPYAQTRRAIVLAAAAIGKEME